MKIGLLLRIRQPIRWILIFPASILLYILTYFLAILITTIFNFISPQFAYGKGFLESVLAPGVASFYSLGLSATLIHENPGRARLVLSYFWMITCGICGGIAFFSSSGSIFLAVLVSAIVFAVVAYLDDDR